MESVSGFGVHTELVKQLDGWHGTASWFTGCCVLIGEPYKDQLEQNKLLVCDST